MIRSILSRMKRMTRAFLWGPDLWKIYFVAGPGAGKTVQLATLYSYLIESGETDDVCISRTHVKIPADAKNINQGVYPLKTPAGTTESFSVQLPDSTTVGLVAPAGEWVSEENHVLDPERRMSELRDGFVVTMFNAFAKEGLAMRAIKGMVATFQQSTLNWDLPEAVRAAMYVLFNLDITLEGMETNGTENRFRNARAVSVDQAILRALENYRLVRLVFRNETQQFEYFVGDLKAEGPGKRRESSADVAFHLDKVWKPLEQLALSRDVTRGLMQRLVQDVDDVIVLLSHCDLLPYIPGIVLSDVVQAHKAAFGSTRVIYDHQLLPIGNLEQNLQPQTEALPKRLVGPDPSGSRALWKAILTTIQRRRPQWPWGTAFLYLPLLMLVTFLSAYFGPYLVEGWTSRSVLTWLGFGFASCVAYLVVEYLRRHGKILKKNLFHRDTEEAPPAYQAPHIVDEFSRHREPPPAPGHNGEITTTVKS